MMPQQPAGVKWKRSHDCGRRNPPEGQGHLLQARVMPGRNNEAIGSGGEDVNTKAPRERTMFHERRCHASSCHDMRPISQQQATSVVDRMSIPRMSNPFQALVRPVHIDSKYKRSLYAPSDSRRAILASESAALAVVRVREGHAAEEAAAIKVDEGIARTLNSATGNRPLDGPYALRSSCFVAALRHWRGGRSLRHTWVYHDD